ncbi:MAG: YidC/Oxa1 family membrane protein insertase [Candidatus Parcubacteria bacterium]|nr:YidC/Oxa1 family membrane protein insertase [Candidatus Parcubacteria bacterium]
MKTLFHTIFFQPMYNALVLLVDILPGGSVGLAVIILTLLVKFVLFPLSQKSVVTQAKMRKLEPELKRVKELHKNNQQELARVTMELYKKEGVNPFSGCFLLLLQLPIIFALYYVFLAGLKFDKTLLYSFVSLPDTVNSVFLGIDLVKKSMLLAVIAGISQYYQIALSMPALPKRTSNEPMSFQEEFSRNMNTQMKYIFPFLVVFISYSISSAIALYWIISNMFAIGQELYVRRKTKTIK